MADSISTGISLEEVRASVQRIRDQSEKLVDRLRTDAKDLIARAPKVRSLEDARKQAEAAVKEIRSRRTQLVTEVVEATIKAFGLATADRVAQLEARVADLERRASSTQAA